jgi:hypothetical protein
VVPLASLGRGASSAVVEAGVRAAGRGDQFGRGAQRRLPVEDDAALLADDDGRPRRRAGAEQLVFDAEAFETIGEETERLLVM